MPGKILGRQRPRHLTSGASMKALCVQGEGGPSQVVPTQASVQPAGALVLGGNTELPP